MDLLDDHMTAVCLVRCVGVHLFGGCVVEERVVPPGVEKRRLVDVLRVQIRDPADHEPSVDSFGLVPGTERGEGDLGNLGVGDPLPGVLVTDRVRVLDLCPRTPSPIIVIAAFTAGSIRTVTDTSAPASITVPMVA